MDKIDELLRLLVVVDNLSMEEVTRNTLKIGLENVHPYFGFYLNGNYKNISYDETTRTWSLINSENKLQQITEDNIEKWQRPTHYRGKKQKIEKGG
jgi:hypothetical protein